ETLHESRIRAKRYTHEILKSEAEMLEELQQVVGEALPYLHSSRPSHGEERGRGPRHERNSAIVTAPRPGVTPRERPEWLVWLGTQRWRRRVRPIAHCDIGSQKSANVVSSAGEGPVV